MPRPAQTSIDKKIRETISNNLTTLTESQKMTQADLAEKTGIKKTTLNGYFKGTSTPNPGNSQKIADALGVSKEVLDPRFSNHVLETLESEIQDKSSIPLYGSIAAGALATVEGITKDNVEHLTIQKELLGKHQNSTSLFAMKVNGESMNKVVPDGSFVVAKPISYLEMKDDDIVIFSHDREYSMKRVRRDEEDKVLVFSPESTNKKFRDIVVPYDTANDLKIYAKVVWYSVVLN
ncbi:repressor LexA [Scopulibacillus darangshiensis]|uniref:Repressor LexA n=1 Tax=Scopulibacillus darangshiensis TaxID=442528 RepID=A0A4R2PAP0_9BACL|nr:LexA family transcriptional regulator [Scopulibacillus darangshiensis]TCP32149.1 repressor LexA [Scopulibacillus darangshiensis]